LCLTVFYLYFINKSKQNAWQASFNPFIWYPKFRSPKISISHPLPHSLQTLHIWSNLMWYTLSSPVGSHHCSRNLYLSTPLLQTRYWQQNSTKRRVPPRYTLWFQEQQPRSLGQDNSSAMFWKFLILWVLILRTQWHMTPQDLCYVLPLLQPQHLQPGQFAHIMWAYVRNGEAKVFAKEINPLSLPGYKTWTIQHAA